jgi:hypothetical protein
MRGIANSIEAAVPRERRGEGRPTNWYRVEQIHKYINAVRREALRKTDSEDRFEEATPVSCAAEDCAHLITTCAVSIEMPMLQFDTCTALAVGDETYLDFRFQR